jgi:hypothetical protein
MYKIYNPGACPILTQGLIWINLVKSTRKCFLPLFKLNLIMMVLEKRFFYLKFMLYSYNINNDLLGGTY